MSIEHYQRAGLALETAILLSRTRMYTVQVEWEQVLALSSKELNAPVADLRRELDETPATREELKSRLLYFRALQELLAKP